MSEPIWCTINIRTPASWVPTDDREPVPWFEQFDLLNGDWSVEVVDGVAEWQTNGEGNYGLYDDDVEAGLDWCQRHRVPYLAESETKYDMGGEIRFFDGATLHPRNGGSSGAVLDYSTWQAMLADESWVEKASDVNHWLVGRVDEYLKPFDLAACDISHLPAEPPRDEEEEDDAT